MILWEVKDVHKTASEGVQMFLHMRMSCISCSSIPQKQLEEGIHHFNFFERLSDYDAPIEQYLM